MDILPNILSSKKLTILIALSWLMAIAYSGWIIHPKVDDGIYLIPAISTLELNFPGVNFSNSVEPIFFIFPTQPFLHGVFLKVLSFFYIDISINTYRLFNSLSVSILLYFTYRLFSIIFYNLKQQRAATNLALILLGGFSQFSLQFYINRPEILGLVFFVLGLIYLIKFIKNIDNSKKNIYMACFQFGLSSIFHPNFLLLSGVAFIYCIYLILNNKKYNYLKFTLIFFLPIAFFIFWFVVNFDIAIDQLFNRVGEVATNSAPSILNIFSVLSGDNAVSAMHNIYLQLHMLTLILVLLSLLLYLVKNSDKKKDLYINKLFKSLSIVIFLSLLLMQPYRPNYLLVSYLSIVTLSFFIVYHGFGISSVADNNYSLPVKLFFPTLCLGLMPLLSVPILHAAKSYVSNGIYDNHHNTLEVLSQFLHSNQHIFITTAQLLPLFSNNIHVDFKNTLTSKGRNIHWYFPVADSPGDKFKELMSNDIKNEQNLMANALWGSLNKTAKFNESMSIVCLSLKGGSVINLHKPEVLFQDKQNIFLTSAKAIPSNKCFK